MSYKARILETKWYRRCQDTLLSLEEDDIMFHQLKFWVTIYLKFRTMMMKLLNHADESFGITEVYDHL